jgi:hypothetical protein
MGLDLAISRLPPGLYAHWAHILLLDLYVCNRELFIMTFAACFYRATGCSVDSLKFVASWKGRLQEAKLQIKVLIWGI